MRVHERQRIYEFLDGRLSERGYAKLEAHLETCDTCREHLEQVREMRSILAEMGDEQPELDWNRVRRGLDEAIDEPVQRNVIELWSRRALVGAAFAAAAALLVVLLQPWLMPADKDESVAERINAPVQPTRTLLDATPASGRLTLVAEGTRWKRPGLRWEDADLQTSVPSGTEMITAEHGVASVQVAPLSGVRIEPGSRVVFDTVLGDSLHMDLHKGAVSVRVSDKSGLTDVRVKTTEANVRITGTTLSVEQQAGATRVAVSQGRVKVTPAGGGQERTLVAPVVAVIDDRGVRVGDDIDNDANASDKIAWLESLHFNFFEQVPATASVSFVPRDGAHAVAVALEGLNVGQAPLAMLAPPQVDHATLSFADGSMLSTKIAVSDTEHTVVSFTSPTIEVEPAKISHAKKLVSKVDPVDVSDDEIEEPGPVHEGFLQPAAVKLVMNKHKGRLRACYEKYLDKEPEVIKVKARIVFTIGVSGKVKEASATTNTTDHKLDQCLAGAMTTVAFPAPVGGTIEFAYPITFTPK